MNILSAWQRGYTGKNVVVTILDDGIERNHPDLVQNYVSALDADVVKLHDDVVYTDFFCFVLNHSCRTIWPVTT